MYLLINIFAISSIQSKIVLQRFLMISQQQANQDKIKLYMSLSQEPIPDVQNQNDSNIYSHFKFYFNDDELYIKRVYPTGEEKSLLHEESFEEQINSTYQQWVVKKDGLNQRLHRNFIAFVEYWVRNTPSLVVSYRRYDQLVKQSVEKFMENTICQFMQSNFSKQKNISQAIDKQKHIKKVRKLDRQSIIRERLIVYFQYFAKYPHHMGTNRKGQTFDEIKQNFATMNLTQWIHFIRKFQFDSFQSEKNQIAKMQTNEEQSQQMKGKIVRDIKWRKNIKIFNYMFQKFCNNKKIIDFEAFYQMIKVLFCQLLQSKDDEVQVLEKGIRFMKLENQTQFQSKLKQLGIFVSLPPAELTGRKTENSKKNQRQRGKQNYLPRIILKGQSKSPMIKRQQTLTLPKIGRQKQITFTLAQLMENRQHKKSHFQSSVREKKLNMQSIINLQQNEDQFLVKYQNKGKEEKVNQQNAGLHNRKYIQKNISCHYSPIGLQRRR